MTDSLWYSDCLRPRLTAWGDGWLVTYTDGVQQVLVQLDEAGHLVYSRPEGVYGYVYAAYTDGSQAELVEETLIAEGSYWLVVHHFDSSGTWTGCDTLYDGTQGNLSYVYVLGSDARDGTLLSVPVTIQVLTDSTVISARVIRYDSEHVSVGASFNLLTLTGQVFASEFFPDAAQGPWNSGLIACSLSGFSGRREEWVWALTDDGQTDSGVPIAQWVDSAGWSGAWLDVLTTNLTVYACYVKPTPEDSLRLGVYVRAFPLSDILRVPESLPELPVALALSVYPNPFNSTTQLSFDLPRSGPVQIVITDITGRLTGTATDGYYTSGSHSVTFDARDLASGIYFATLRSGSVTQSRKLVLLK